MKTKLRHIQGYIARPCSRRKRGPTIRINENIQKTDRFESLTALAKLVLLELSSDNL